MEVTLEALAGFAKEFVGALPQSQGKSALVVGLRGDLGAGKTTFVQAVARELGVKEDVTSPTFVIAQRYATTHPNFTHLIHIDAYRLASTDSDTIGFAEYMKDPNNLILVEWPDNLAAFPNDAQILQFETVDETTRRVV